MLVAPQRQDPESDMFDEFGWKDGEERKREIDRVLYVWGSPRVEASTTVTLPLVPQAVSANYFTRKRIETVAPNSRWNSPEQPSIP